MNSLMMTIVIGLLMNIPAILPVLFLKIDKSHKTGIAIRVYLVSVLLIFSLVTLTSNITNEYSPFPFWLPIASVVLFMIALVNCVKHIRKFVTKWKRRTIILTSFIIVYAIRFNVIFINTGLGFEITSFGIVWSAFFVFACLLAYIGTSDTQKLDSAYNALSNHSSETRVDKSYASQTDIDYDVSIKGRSVLNDPNLSLIEQQRYRDALQKKEDEGGSGW